jgi:farnesyl-diphosphate farnesyltransferase
LRCAAIELRRFVGALAEARGAGLLHRLRELQRLVLFEIGFLHGHRGTSGK